MLDLIESKLARQEFEQRVWSLTPVQDHDERLSDDRQLTIYPIQSGVLGINPIHSDWVARRAGQLLYSVGSGLAALGERLEHGRNPASAHANQEQSSALS